MDTKDLKGLMEAYSEVYAPQENIDEGLRSAVKRLLGGGKKEAEAPKPESRGEQLRKKYNVGPEKSDTSAKRQILNRSRARAERDEKDYGSSKYSKSVAQKSKAAHERYLKAGYSKYGADLKHGSGNKARKRAAALNREEFEFIVNSLIEEGYDLSLYTYDEMYEICLDEAVKGADPEMRRAASAERRGGDKRLSPSTGKGYADQQKQSISYMDKVTKKNKNVVGLVTKEELDIFDVVLEFLQVEGFAETLEEAEWMMANMIDEEAIDIILGEALTGERYKKVMKKPGGAAYSRMVSADPSKRATRGGRGGESDFGAGDRGSGNKAARRAGTYQEEYVDEAQHARENPEKYEREQAKKSAPVRGERTPMPPRGDKRREDFEKWYAKQMGR